MESSSKSKLFFNMAKQYANLYLGGAGLRKLNQEEIKSLTAQGNFSTDWRLVEVEDGFTPEFIHGSVFVGKCILGVFTGKTVPSVGLPSGIYRSTVNESRIMSEALVIDVGRLQRCLVCEQACVQSVGTVSADEKTKFCIGTELTVGCEIGKRKLILSHSIDYAKAADIVMRPKVYSDRTTDSQNEEFTAPASIIGQFALVTNCGQVRNVYIGEQGRINGAALVADAVILSKSDAVTEITSGAVVRQCYVSEGCAISQMAIADRCFFAPYVTATRHAKVTDCVVGSNTEIAEGETTSCLIGPFVGFHHQSLLIAALWPDGRGNIGYGANAGSNHTGRAPDQELICGEGLFIGLGTSVKFPANYRSAAYSIIATGVCALPQRVEFPFSLINTPSKIPQNIPIGFNEIIPAWVLTNSVYAVLRNESKFAKRNRAEDPLLARPVFNRQIADMMVSAQGRLASVTDKDIYTETDILGLGKNFMTAASRRQAIEAYEFYIRFYLTNALLNYLQHQPDAIKSGNKLFADETTNDEWEHARKLIVNRGMDSTSIKELLLENAAACKRIAESALASKQKDDARGKRIIDEYIEATPTAEEDIVIKEAFARAEKTDAEARRLLGL